MHIIGDVAKSIFHLLKKKREPKEPKKSGAARGAAAEEKDQEEKEHRDHVRAQQSQWGLSQSQQDEADLRFYTLQCPSDVFSRSRLPFKRTGEGSCKCLRYSLIYDDEPQVP